MQAKSSSQFHPPRYGGRRTFARAALLSLSAASAALGISCLERPVVRESPATSNQFVDTVTLNRVDKIDLLFMVDSSRSMADKQVILEAAVPVLLKRLITPDCLDATDARTGQQAVDGVCPPGTYPEFRPIDDIHVGVISSSLGAAGGDGCKLSDLAQFVPSVPLEGRPALDSWNGAGFLAWDPDGSKNTPPGENDLNRFVDSFRSHVVGTGENGCGFEASLEAWYRFLIDPEPPLDVTVAPPANDPTSNLRVALRGPINQTLLEQRAQFLRPDSLLAIVMLSDENDCSILDLDGTQGFMATNTRVAMPRASSACAEDPNAACCRSCAAEPAAGCPSNAEDAECQKPAFDDKEDSDDMRCFDQKRRFGLDLLHPIERYVRGLRERMVPNRKGQLVPNPIYDAPPGVTPRDRNLVFLAGIVGVPWQDIATDASLAGDGLRYLSARELEKNGRWPLIVGDRANHQPPLDPLMRESIAPRSGTHPITLEPLAPATAAGIVNSINGHEQNVVNGDDLQYACIFPLPTPRDCAGLDATRCDCTAEDQEYNRPLCDYTQSHGEGAGIQTHAKAYPGIRQLEVLRGIGDHGIVASICPRYLTAAPNLQAEDDPNFGYNPAITNIIDAIKTQLGDRCLPRPLAPEASEGLAQPGRVPCLVTEATPVPEGGACSCDGPGRKALDGEQAVARRAILQEIELDGQCGEAMGVPAHAV